MPSRDHTPKPPFPPQHLTPPGVEERMPTKPFSSAPGYLAAGKLRDRAVLITGGDSGIGRAVAILFAREGADVAIVHLPEEMEDARAVEKAVKAEGRRFISVAGDVGDGAFCRHAVEKAVKAFGRLDILVNNAAYQQHLDRLEDLTEEQWNRTFRTNITGYFLMVKAALPHLPAGGVIINTGSIVGLEGSRSLIDYASTKGAIHAFTKSLAKALVDRGIRVNCISPGPVWTPLNPAERDEESTRTFGADTPMGRPAQPEEIAPAYVFFASNGDSGYVTGEVLTELGGETRAA